MRRETTVIAITQRLTFVESYEEERESLDTQWHDFADQLGCVQLVPISYKSDPCKFLEQFNVDCVILSGGNDLYQAHPRAAKDVGEVLSNKRDLFERNLIEQARLRGIRILGVCRGLQVLALYYGGKVTRISCHVGRSHALSRYQDSTGNKEASTFAKKCCSYIFEEDGTLKGSRVNSYHNYAPMISSSLHKDIEVLAVATDANAIEAFVHAPDRVAAIMWHPERSHGVQRKRDVSLVRCLLDIPEKSYVPIESPSYDVCTDTVRVVILCAGQGTRLRPLTDNVPKCMVKYKGRAIIDYLLSVYHHHGLHDITLVSGYKSHELKRPGVKYVHNELYASTNMVKSLFCVLSVEDKGSRHDLIVSYSDIIYTQEVLRQLLSSNGHGADVMVVIDVDWLNLWQSRMEDPLADAETLRIGSDGFLEEIGRKPETYDDIEGQYIGLIKFTAKGVDSLKHFFLSIDPDGLYDGKTKDNMYMTTLLQLMIDSGMKIRPILINGGWTEIDCQDDLNVDIDFSMIPNDVFRGQSLNFGTKAETLLGLSCLNVCEVLPLVYFTNREWKDADLRPALLEKCVSLADGNHDLLIVRSSASKEDSLESSGAGVHDTVKNVPVSYEEIEKAVLAVFASYTNADEDDQVLIQPMLRDVDVCGVLCTTELHDYMPYFVMSYESGGGTDAVTSGSHHQIKTIYVSKYACTPLQSLIPWQQSLLDIANRLENVFKNDKLDIEFAVKHDHVYILQARPVVVPRGVPHALEDEFVTTLREVYQDLGSKLKHEEILDNMMDWNPAEMIGVLPSPLARTLYETLITDEIAMQSRSQLGYRDVSHEPLMFTIAGRPFIRASVSFESFIPASLDDTLASKLVKYYLSVLQRFPEKRDKVEFEIVFSCFEPDLDTRLERLDGEGFTRHEKLILRQSLLEMTDGILRRTDDDLATVSLLHQKIVSMKRHTRTEKHNRISQAIELTRTFGTLPFANLARCAFVAVSLLKSLQRTGHLSEDAYNDFMESLHTVGKGLSEDLAALRRHEKSREEFLTQYGHLRPGTYDIRNARYDENFDLYFSDAQVLSSRLDSHKREFLLEDSARASITSYLLESGMSIDCDQLFEFCRKSIEGREKAKFIFTAAVSDILVDIADLGSDLNIHKFDMSFLDLKQYLKERGIPGRSSIFENITHNRTLLSSMAKVKLPATICESNDIYIHEERTVRPNFVTKKCVDGMVVTESHLFDVPLDGKIVVVESADPGWDWLFSNDIAGLVTCYGGANSHMAIRAAELSLPAAIGVGTSKFKQYVVATRLRIDSSMQTITVIQC